jgi:long-chain acyl-CoA synthetase
MRGYHDRPEENAAAFTEDGGLRTGDLGYLDEDGFFFNTGRIKEQYKLENGKYVMPSTVEEELKLSPFIANVLVVGAGRPYNVAIVVPDRAALEDWARSEGIVIEDPARDARVHALLLSEIEAHGRGALRGYEIPKRMLVAAEDFTTENGLLNPTMKPKRREIEGRYRGELDSLYAASAEVRAPLPP